MDEKRMIKEVNTLFGIDDTESINVEYNGNFDSLIEVFDMQIEVFKNYEEAEKRAIELLTDDPYFWKIAVENDETESSLEDWAESVIAMDGIIGICNYDGNYYEGNSYNDDGDYYVYIRIN